MSLSSLSGASSPSGVGPAGQGLRRHTLKWKFEKDGGPSPSTAREGPLQGDVHTVETGLLSPELGCVCGPCRSQPGRGAECPGVEGDPF